MDKAPVVASPPTDFKPPKIETSIAIIASASSDSPAAQYSPSDPEPAEAAQEAPLAAAPPAPKAVEPVPETEAPAPSVCMPRDQAWVKLLAYEV